LIRAAACSARDPNVVKGAGFKARPAFFIAIGTRIENAEIQESLTFFGRKPSGSGTQPSWLI
jgi:hypothetical protein